MTKQLRAQANGTSAANNGAVISVTGTVIAGTKDARGRFIYMEVHPSIVSILVEHMVNYYPEDFAKAVRVHHPERPWRSQDEQALDARMRAIADLIDSFKRNPRENADDAYQAFMSMEQSEWLGLLTSLAGGGTLTPAEQEGFERAYQERPLRQV